MFRIIRFSSYSAKTAVSKSVAADVEMLFSVLCANLLLCSSQLNSHFCYHWRKPGKYCYKNVKESSLGPSRPESCRQVLTFSSQLTLFKESCQDNHSVPHLPSALCALLGKVVSKEQGRNLW